MSSNANLIRSITVSVRGCSAAQVLGVSPSWKTFSATAVDAMNCLPALEDLTFMTVIKYMAPVQLFQGGAEVRYNWIKGR